MSCEIQYAGLMTVEEFMYNGRDMIPIRALLSNHINKTTSVNRAFMIAELRQRKGVFLEVGSGSAPLLKYIEQVPNDNKIVMDLPGELAVGLNLGYKRVEQDAGVETWFLADESVDVIVSDQCIEHIPNTDHFINEASRVLKKKGIFLISTPNQGALLYILYLLLTINPPMNNVSDRFVGLGNPFHPDRFKAKDEYAGHAHLRLFSTRAMNDLLRAYGFKILKNHGGSLGIPLIGKPLAAIFPYYGLKTTVVAQKI